MHISKYKKTGLALTAVFSLTACSSTDTTTTTTGTPTATQSADDTMTTSINFSGGTLKSGSPPTATNNPGDIFLSPPAAPPANATPLTPSSSGTLKLTVNQVPAGQSLNVNVRFGSSTSYINIPVPASIQSQVAANGGAGTLNFPFSLPANICNKVANIQHQIQCYESVDVGGGQMVSKETARQMLLACGTGGTGGTGGFATGPNDYCVDDYPVESCNLLGSGGVGLTTQFIANSLCTSAFPSTTASNNLGVVYNCSTDTSGAFTQCGACGVQTPVRSRGLAGQAANLETIMYEQLLEYQNNPQAQQKITFTPN